LEEKSGMLIFSNQQQIEISIDEKRKNQRQMVLE